MSQNGVNFPLPPAPSGGGGGGLPDPGSNGFVIRTGPGVTSAIALITNAYLQNSTVNYPAGTGLTGGGSVSLGGTATAFAVSYGTTAGTAAQGNDVRLPPAPAAAGRLLYDSGTAWQALSSGAAGQVLLANGAAAPSWGALPFSSLTSKPTTISGYGITDAVPATRQILAGAGLTGGGDLSADRTLAADFGTASGKVAQGNDSRFPAAPSAAGRVLYDNGTAWVALAAGTSGQVLKANGAAAPSWGNAPLGAQTIVLGSMGPTGTWSNNQFIGPNYATFSSSGTSGYSGSGVKRMRSAGTLSNFAINAASTSAYNFDVEIYAGPDPASLTPTGVVVSVTIGPLVFTNNISTLSVAAGDCIALFNTDPVNTWGCGALECVADFTP